MAMVDERAYACPGFPITDHPYVPPIPGVGQGKQLLAYVVMRMFDRPG